jgi:hypothetical protein
MLWKTWLWPAPTAMDESKMLSWSADFSLIIGLTPTGRATIARLQTNHSGVVRQRQVLSALGLHP